MQLEIVNVHHSLGNGSQRKKIINGINFSMQDGEFVSLIGPSGCGKSTLFNLIAGLDEPNEGDILLNGESIVGKRGHISYMMQKDLLFPWKTILENVLLGATIRKQNIQQLKEEALQLFPLFGLDGYENHYPKVLSGGMKQRASLMRTFLHKTDLLLLDEPFGALDALTREKMHEWLLEICSRMQRSILFITHSIDEAIFLSDRIYVLSTQPTEITYEIQVTLPRPRVKDMTVTQEYLDIKTQLMGQLYSDRK